MVLQATFLSPVFQGSKISDRHTLLHVRQPGKELGKAPPSKYSVRQPPDLRSRYTLIMEERARRRLLAEQQQQQQEKRDSDPSLAESQHEQQVDA